MPGSLSLDSHVVNLVLSVTDSWEGQGAFNRYESSQEVVDCSGYHPVKLTLS